MYIFYSKAGAMLLKEQKAGTNKKGDRAKIARTQFLDILTERSIKISIATNLFIKFHAKKLSAHVWPLAQCKKNTEVPWGVGASSLPLFSTVPSPPSSLLQVIVILFSCCKWELVQGSTPNKLILPLNPQKPVATRTFLLLLLNNLPTLK
jgi:hypothetical protein